MGGKHAKALAGAVVEPVHREDQLLQGDSREVAVVGALLPHQAGIEFLVRDIQLAAKATDHSSRVNSIGLTAGSRGLLAALTVPSSASIKVSGMLPAIGG